MKGFNTGIRGFYSPWIASPTQWTWVRANSWRYWRTGESGVLMDSWQGSLWGCRVWHDWATEQHHPPLERLGVWWSGALSLRTRAWWLRVCLEAIGTEDYCGSASGQSLPAALAADFWWCWVSRGPLCHSLCQPRATHGFQEPVLTSENLTSVRGCVCLSVHPAPASWESLRSLCLSLPAPALPCVL